MSLKSIQTRLNMLQKSKIKLPEELIPIWIDYIKQFDYRHSTINHPPINTDDFFLSFAFDSTLAPMQEKRKDLDFFLKAIVPQHRIYRHSFFFVIRQPFMRHFKSTAISPFNQHILLPVIFDSIKYRFF